MKEIKKIPIIQPGCHLFFSQSEEGRWIIHNHRYIMLHYQPESVLLSFHKRRIAAKMITSFYKDDANLLFLGSRYHSASYCPRIHNNNTRSAQQEQIDKAHQ